MIMMRMDGLIWFIWMIIDMYLVYINIMMIMDGSGCHGARQESGLNQLNNGQEHIHEPK